MKIWDFKTGDLLQTITDSRVESIGFSPDGQYVLAGVPGNLVDIGDLKAGKIILTLGHPGWRNKIAFSRDGKHVADSIGRLWLMTANDDMFQYLKQVDRGVECTDFSPDGKMLIGITARGVVYFWKLNNFRARRTIQLSHTERAASLALSPDGTLLATCYHTDSVTRIWSAASGKLLRELNNATARTSSVTFSPDGYSLATGNSDGSLKIWRIK